MSIISSIVRNIKISIGPNHALGVTVNDDCHDNFPLNTLDFLPLPLQKKTKSPISIFSHSTFIEHRVCLVVVSTLKGCDISNHNNEVLANKPISIYLGKSLEKPDIVTIASIQSKNVSTKMKG